MFKIYLACFIVGGIFIAISLFFGGDTDADVDVDADVEMDVDVDGDVDFQSDMDIDADADVDVDSDAAGDAADSEGLVEGAKFLSFRNAIFFVAFFGMTGTIFNLLNIPAFITLPSAIVMGGIASFLMHKTLNHLVRNEVDSSLNLNSLTGMPANVTINLSRQNKGKITLNANGRKFQLLAITADEADRDNFQEGETVIVLRVKDNTAYVVEKEFV